VAWRNTLLNAADGADVAASLMELWRDILPSVRKGFRV
jgi:hypothetical protein